MSTGTSISKSLRIKSGCVRDKIIFVEKPEPLRIREFSYHGRFDILPSEDLRKGVYLFRVHREDQANVYVGEPLTVVPSNAYEC